MQKLINSEQLELELARARRMLAEGRRQEALMTALNLLQHTLGQLRQGLLAMHRNLAHLKDGLARDSNVQEAKQASFPSRTRAGGKYYH